MPLNSNQKHTVEKHFDDMGMPGIILKALEKCGKNFINAVYDEKYYVENKQAFEEGGAIKYIDRLRAAYKGFIGSYEEHFAAVQTEYEKGEKQYHDDKISMEEFEKIKLCYLSEQESREPFLDAVKDYFSGKTEELFFKKLLKNTFGEESTQEKIANFVEKCQTIEAIVAIYDKDYYIDNKELFAEKELAEDVEDLRESYRQFIKISGDFAKNIESVNKILGISENYFTELAQQIFDKKDKSTSSSSISPRTSSERSLEESSSYSSLGNSSSAVERYSQERKSRSSHCLIS